MAAGHQKIVRALAGQEDFEYLGDLFGPWLQGAIGGERSELLEHVMKPKGVSWPETVALSTVLIELFQSGRQYKDIALEIWISDTKIRENRFVVSHSISLTKMNGHTRMISWQMTSCSIW